MSINLKVYRKIGYEEVYPGMGLRIVTEGPGFKSDVEGTVNYMFRGGPWFGDTSFVLADYDKVTFKHDRSTSHVAKCPAYVVDTTIELYEVIDTIPDEPTGVGSVVRVVNLAHPDQTREAVKMGREFSWVWSDNAFITTWDSITSRVLSSDYDYIEVLREGIEL